MLRYIHYDCSYHILDNPYKLFAGTMCCHTMAANFLGSFGVPYKVVCGNHNLEGIGEFDTNARNLCKFLKLHSKEMPQFCRQVAKKTLLVGPCSAVFRDMRYMSHEVIIDERQIDWFNDLVRSRPANEEWRVFVFSHAPSNGSRIRIILENNVVNGCYWLNHSNERNSHRFIEIIRENRCIKGWFSGHFHLRQDYYQDSITFPMMIDPLEGGPCPDRGSCIFTQMSVMQGGALRDGRRQLRLLHSTRMWFEICTIDHKNGGKVRVDATVVYSNDSHKVCAHVHEDKAYNHNNYFRIYQPQFDNHCYLSTAEGEDETCLITPDPVMKKIAAWWRLSCGSVLGVVNGMMLELNRSTLAPLGLVVLGDMLLGKRVAIVDSGLEECPINFNDNGMDGAKCADGPELAGGAREQVRAGFAARPDHLKSRRDSAFFIPENAHQV
jgi:hypothetical protein